MVQALGVKKLTDESKPGLSIVATFTAEPLEDALTYWMKELDFPFRIEFAPYNQVFQQLLDPNSLLSRNEKGMNVVLLRLEDWLRYEGKAEINPLDQREKVERNLRELVQALQVASQCSPTPIFVCLCLASPGVVADTQLAAYFQGLEEQLASELQSLSAVYLVTSTELVSRYPVKDYYDSYSDDIGHIPYTPAFFTVLATMLARKIYSFRTPARKVIVLDCDNTLWRGVCAESGPLGIEIDAPYRALQEFMVAQHAAGRLLCLCSKNSAADVLEVFTCHPDMPLKREHIIAWQINWKPKSENLLALAEELQLGLDSFIFLDDNPLECAEVQAHCPEVLTLQLPQEAERISRFLEHVWPFDYLKVTETDRQRTALYRQNVQREHARQEASTIEDFLATLELEIRIFEMRPEHLERVAQLTQRTNQFNFTPVRRTESEIRRLCAAENLEVHVVEVRDRFGDYGLVGVMAFVARADSLQVDTFLLSCRVLGRGVEHQMWKALGEIALARRLGTVAIPFIPTQKNQPALEFLNSVGSDYRRADEQNGWLFVFPTQNALGS